jgi:MYXO-CTERM domain-containing protein
MVHKMLYLKSFTAVGGLVMLSLALTIGAPSARADTIVFSSPLYTSGSSHNSVPVGYNDGTPGWPGGDALGNTITFGGIDRLLTTMDLGLFSSGTWTVDLYNGINPNTGALLGSASASTGCDCVFPSVVFDFTSQNIHLPNTITFVVTGIGAGDRGALSGLSPAIGTGVDSMWYGPGLSPTSFVQNSAWAIADGAPNDNYLEAQFNATTSPTPEPGSFGVLALGLAGLVTAVRRRKRA